MNDIDTTQSTQIPYEPSKSSCAFLHRSSSNAKTKFGGFQPMPCERLRAEKAKKNMMQLLGHLENVLENDDKKNDVYRRKCWISHEQCEQGKTTDGNRAMNQHFFQHTPQNMWQQFRVVPKDRMRLLVSQQCNDDAVKFINGRFTEDYESICVGRHERRERHNEVLGAFRVQRMMNFSKESRISTTFKRKLVHDNKRYHPRSAKAFEQHQKSAALARCRERRNHPELAHRMKDLPEYRGLIIDPEEFEQDIDINLLRHCACIRANDLYKQAAMKTKNCSSNDNLTKTHKKSSPYNHASKNFKPRLRRSLTASESLHVSRQVRKDIELFERHRHVVQAMKCSPSSLYV